MTEWEQVHTYIGFSELRIVYHSSNMLICLSPGYGLCFLFMAATPVLRSKLSKLVDPSEQGQSPTEHVQILQKNKRLFLIQQTVQIFQYVMIVSRKKQLFSCPHVIVHNVQDTSGNESWMCSGWISRQMLIIIITFSQVPCLPLLPVWRAYVFWWAVASSTPSTQPRCTSWRASPSFLLPSSFSSPLESLGEFVPASLA